VKITVPHNQSREQVMKAVDKSLNELFQGIAILPVHFVEDRRTWRGSTLAFSLTAKTAFISTPIKGTIEVTDREVIIDVDLGMLERLIPATRVREVVSQRVRGLLE
jgi:aryl-alcohol dehydrogenase-like predicted oxidoreductase